MFHLIVFAMFGLMLYGLWTLLGNLSRLKLPKATPKKTTRQTRQVKAPGQLAKRSNPPAQRIRTIQEQAAAHDAAYAEVCRVRKLRKNLLGMLRGNSEAVDRLVESARKAKPFMGDEWYYEKAIADLERDRFR